MANGTTTLTEVREQETANTLKWVGIGVAIILFAAFMIYFLGLFLKTDPASAQNHAGGHGVGDAGGHSGDRRGCCIASRSCAT